MDKWTAEDAAGMTATAWIDAIAELSPEIAKIVRKARADGIADLPLLNYFQAALFQELMLDADFVTVNTVNAIGECDTTKIPASAVRLCLRL